MMIRTIDRLRKSTMQVISRMLRCVCCLVRRDSVVGLVVFVVTLREVLPSFLFLEVVWWRLVELLMLSVVARTFVVTAANKGSSNRHKQLLEQEPHRHIGLQKQQQAQAVVTARAAQMCS